MSYRVRFAPEAVEQLAALYNHIADAASADIAKSIPQYLAFGRCGSLTEFLCGLSLRPKRDIFRVSATEGG